jgi:hypothetical protein
VASAAVDLTAAVPPIHVFNGAFDDLLTGSDVVNLGSLVVVGPDQHPDLPDLLKQFLRFRLADQQSEADTHTRNDALLEAISRVSGMEKRSRDVQAPSTIRRKRPDAHSGFSHRAPFAFEEEKASDDDIDKAQQDLCNKFRWLPHYPAGAFVFGIPIAGDVFRFGYFTRGPDRPGFTRLGEWNTKSIAGVARSIDVQGGELFMDCFSSQMFCAFAFPISC